MSKENKKRIVLLSTGVAMLIIFIIFSCILSNPGKDYTKEYNIHLALLELENIDDVEAYLTENNVSYEINNSTLTLNDYDNIEYVIRTDNSTGYLIPSDKFVYLSKLDAKDYEIVTVEKEATENGFNEHIFLKHKGITYSKYNGEYFIQTTWILQLIKTVSNIGFIAISVYLVLDYLDLYFKMRAREKSKKDDSAKAYKQ
ncbi:MAG: hypothetical protein IKL68_03520 [Clostridia bacterium]|nr:hypothetical protein [Clostridia bacterium]